MARVKFKLNRKGVRDVLRSDPMLELVKTYGQRVKDRCGDGYELSTMTGKNRVNASIKVSDIKSYYDNLRNNTLIKNLR